MNNGPLRHLQLFSLQADRQKFQQRTAIGRGAQTRQAEPLNFSEVV